MAFTSHGHQIPLSPSETRTSSTPSVGRCGGVRLCIRCQEDAVGYISRKIVGEVNSPELMARQAVLESVNEDLDLGDRIQLDDVYILWFTDLGQGEWRAMLSTALSIKGDIYHEVVCSESRMVTNVYTRHTRATRTVNL